MPIVRGIMRGGPADVVSTVSTTYSSTATFGATKCLRILIPSGSFTGISTVTGIEVDCEGGSVSLTGGYVQNSSSDTSFDFVTAPSQLLWSGSGTTSISLSQVKTTDRLTVALDPTKALILSFGLNSGDQTFVHNTATGPWKVRGNGDQATMDDTSWTSTINFGDTAASLVKAVRLYGTA